MKISDIISREEYIVSEINDSTEFNRLSDRVQSICDGDVLVIPNSKRAPKQEEYPARPLAVICDTEAYVPCGIPTIRVTNPRLAYARAFYRYEKAELSSVKIIGVTGTNGKTTTATLIKRILSSLGYRVGFIGTGMIESDGRRINGHNYSMTTPDPPLLYQSMRQMVEDGCNVIVMEVSSHSLTLDKVEPLIFDYGIFTNLSPEHLDFHESMEEYFGAKMRLINRCKAAIINIDDGYGQKALNLYEGRKISCGVLWKGNVWASNIRNLGFDGIEYTYHGDGFSFKMRLPIAGEYNCYNSMLAAAVCIDMGCPPCRVKNILAESESVAGRYQIINDKISVIIDYAHTSAAFDTILRELSRQKKGGRLTVVFGCGGDRDKSKRPRMANIAEKYADRIILTADNSRNESTKDIISDIIAGFEKGSYEIKENRENAIFSAILGAEDGDIVAIIGKGPEEYNIDKDGYHRFVEKEIVNAALTKRNGAG
ncbi:MAG: UDP-N-acetylmuramoyl-L-alanyl-D-glutamate--2,6-diaminopimelate ligase [Clostridia bacterium]|nr:UDP-N-acetylmuramoyl-L-alanyl-D-glutamate--2,6-diaminopimelate ligase [Clostridia bacterium]